MNGFYMGFKDTKLSEVKHFRMTKEILNGLEQERDKRGSNLSQVIRDILEEKLTGKV